MGFRDVFIEFPELETTRLRLRRMDYDDADDFYEIYGNNDVTKYLDWNGPRNEEMAEMLIEYFNNEFENMSAIRWGIEEKDSRMIIGTIVLHGFIKEGIADMGYDLHRKFWGKGYMTEALKTVLDFCFNEMNLHRIQCQISPDNKPSLALVTKLGFKEEGLLRKRGYHEDDKYFYDIKQFALLDTD
jgi:ribosomal-protein-alanine N-acetyltransferase